jgi:hypothetical protein
MGIVVVAAVLLVASGVPARAEDECETSRCAVQRTIDERCPCAEATTHGAHVRCVAQVVKELAAAGMIPISCKGKITRCAARSTCGRRPGSVVCDVPRLGGVCAIGLGFCIHPDGSIRYTHPCSADADCVLESRCRISASAERCTARGGTVATRTSCCAECAPSSGTPCAPGVTCSADEICVRFGPVGPGGFSLTCHPVPVGCELDRTCGCVAPALCPEPHVCYDVEAPGDVIFCECNVCV